ncbi:hypothetical protein QYF36_015371 [Acer negundo]|nr:hypothetical protein QYF36_015371 [Acer negundo]
MTVVKKSASSEEEIAVRAEMIAGREIAPPMAREEMGSMVKSCDDDSKREGSGDKEPERETKLTTIEQRGGEIEVVSEKAPEKLEAWSKEKFGLFRKAIHLKQIGLKVLFERPPKIRVVVKDH